MPKVLISYYSKTGNTEKLAGAIEEGLASVLGVEVVKKSVMDTEIEDLMEADGIILGSPTYFATMAAPVKSLIDRSIKCFGKLNGKVGGAFTTSGGVAGGNETTLMHMLEALLVHGMVVQGIQKGAHFGSVAVRQPSDEELQEAVKQGKLTGELVMKLFG